MSGARRWRHAAAATLLFGFAATGCASVPPSDSSVSTSLTEPVPAGLGRLRQDDFTVTLTAGPLQLKVTPLEEWVIRLAAPDTYARLRELAATHGVAGRTLFLVSVFTTQQGTSFEEQDLHLTNRGRTVRPLAIRPISPGWSGGRLRARQTESAIYAFDSSLDLRLDLGVEYGGVSSGAWTRILEILRDEHARIKARAGTAG